MSGETPDNGQIGTDAEQTTHRPPAPTLAENNAAIVRTSPAQDYANGADIRDALNSTSHGVH